MPILVKFTMLSAQPRKQELVGLARFSTTYGNIFFRAQPRTATRATTATQPRIQIVRKRLNQGVDRIKKTKSVER